MWFKTSQDPSWDERGVRLVTVIKEETTSFSSSQLLCTHLHTTHLWKRVVDKPLMVQSWESMCGILVWSQHFVFQRISDAGWFLYAFIWKIGQFPWESPSLHVCVSLTSCLIHPFLFPHLQPSCSPLSIPPFFPLTFRSTPHFCLCLAHNNTLVGWMFHPS